MLNSAITSPPSPFFLSIVQQFFSLSVLTVALLSLPASKFKGKDSKNGEKKSWLSPLLKVIEFLFVLFAWMIVCIAPGIHIWQSAQFRTQPNRSSPGRFPQRKPWALMPLPRSTNQSKAREMTSLIHLQRAVILSLACPHVFSLVFSGKFPASDVPSNLTRSESKYLNS